MKKTTTKPKTRAPSKASMQRFVRPSDSEMVDWIAEFVTHIRSVVHKSGVLIEMEAENDDDLIVVSRSGPKERAAFRKCVRDGMNKFPLPNAKLNEPDTTNDQNGT